MPLTHRSFPYLAAGPLILAGCQAHVEPPKAAPLSSQELVASFGHALSVRYENAKAYELAQKALYWRGRVDPGFSLDQLTESKRVAFLLSIDGTPEFRHDADIFITEEEAAMAWQKEYQVARRNQALAPPTSPLSPEAAADPTRVVR